jgi:hypothetical protein
MTLAHSTEQGVFKKGLRMNVSRFCYEIFNLELSRDLIQGYISARMTIFPPTILAIEPDNGRESFAQKNPTNKTTKQRETDLACTNPQYPLEKDRSRRPRYASGRRYSRSHNLRQDSFHDNGDDEVSTGAGKDRLHHDKNKLAARKLRLRQRREIRTAQENVRCLEKANAELNAQIHGLQGEIDEVQAFASDHQKCDCRIMRYDCDHAETVDENSRVSSADGGEYGSRKEWSRFEMFGKTTSI